MGRTPAFLLLAGLLMMCAGCASRAAASRPMSATGGVTAVWRPEINAPLQRRVTTHGTVVQAVDLVRDVAAAPPFPKSVTSCPASLGVGVNLTLDSGGRTEHVLVLLTGCATVGLNGGDGQLLTNAIAKDLRPLAPPNWQRYLRDY
jgi:hypothetical protein